MSTTDERKIVNLSQKGRATIPKPLREKHGIEPGSKVRFRENEQGEIVIEPLPSLQEFRGAAPTSERGTAILQEERAVADTSFRTLVHPLVESDGHSEYTGPSGDILHCVAYYS